MASEIIRISHIATVQDTFPCLDVGAGPAVIFLHGALGDLRTWRRHCAILSERCRCIAYTQRYFGGAAWRHDGPPFGTATHADDLIAVVEAFDIGPVSLVAWSYAGHTALRAVLLRPDLFSRLLVFEPGVPSCVTDPDELGAFARDAELMFGPIFRATDEGRLRDAVRLLIDASGGSDAYFERQSVERQTIELDNAYTMPLLLAQAAPPPIRCQELGALRVSVSIAWGVRSRPVFTIPSRAAARCIRSGRHREIPGVGHLWPDEEPAAFVAFVGDWLERGA